MSARRRAHWARPVATFLVGVALGVAAFVVAVQVRDNLLLLAVTLFASWALICVPLALLIGGIIARREVQRITRENAEDTTGGERS